MRSSPGRLAIRMLEVGVSVAVITFLCITLIPANVTTVGFAYLIAILIIAASWGFVEALAASILSVLCFNYFFFPPKGTFRIAEPGNWVALSAFLVTSVVASRLSEQAKRRTGEALARQKETERLYALSRALLLTNPTRPVAQQIVHQIAQIFDCRAVALYDGTSGETHHAGPEDMLDVEDKLQQAALQGTFFTDPATRVTVTAVRLGGRPIGSLALCGTTLPDTALQALANLVAIGLEKQRAQEVSSRAEAARQSAELKSTLLDALAHEFKTPLTSIKAAGTELLSSPTLPLSQQRELLTVMDEEVDRLGRLVTEAIQMARIEAGKMQLNRSLHAVSDLLVAALKPVKLLIEERRLDLCVAPDLPMVFVDGDLMGLAIRQLLNNALKFSPPKTAVTVEAKCDAEGVVICVCDHGPGLAEGEQAHVFEKFYRGPSSGPSIPGTGMGLAIAREIGHAHGGKIWVESNPGSGSRFCISVPAAGKEATP